MQQFFYRIFFLCLPKRIKCMSGIININKLVDLMGDKNHYTYARVKNLLSGLKGRSSKKDIQQVRRLLNKELTAIDNVLQKLENE